jgi:hypothetical protein
LGSNAWIWQENLNVILESDVYNSVVWINSDTQKSWILNNKWRLGSLQYGDGNILERYEKREKESSLITSSHIGLMTIIDF